MKNKKGKIISGEAKAHQTEHMKMEVKTTGQYK